MADSGHQPGSDGVQRQGRKGRGRAAGDRQALVRLLRGSERGQGGVAPAADSVIAPAKPGPGGARIPSVAPRTDSATSRYGDHQLRLYRRLRRLTGEERAGQPTVRYQREESHMLQHVVFAYGFNLN